jgi:hypothetical protein
MTSALAPSDVFCMLQPDYPRAAVCIMGAVYFDFRA